MAGRKNAPSSLQLHQNISDSEEGHNSEPTSGNRPNGRVYSPDYISPPCYQPPNPLSAQHQSQYQQPFTTRSTPLLVDHELNDERSENHEPMESPYYLQEQIKNRSLSESKQLPEEYRGMPIGGDPPPYRQPPKALPIRDNRYQSEYSSDPPGHLALPPTDYRQQYFTQGLNGGNEVNRRFSPLRLPIVGTQWRVCSWRLCALAFLTLSLGLAATTIYLAAFQVADWNGSGNCLPGSSDVMMTHSPSSHTHRLPNQQRPAESGKEIKLRGSLFAPLLFPSMFAAYKGNSNSIMLDIPDQNADFPHDSREYSRAANKRARKFDKGRVDTHVRLAHSTPSFPSLRKVSVTLYPSRIMSRRIDSSLVPQQVIPLSSHTQFTFASLLDLRNHRSVNNVYVLPLYAPSLGNERRKRSVEGEATPDHGGSTKLAPSILTTNAAAVVKEERAILQYNNRGDQNETSEHVISETTDFMKNLMSQPALNLPSVSKIVEKNLHMSNDEKNAFLSPEDINLYANDIVNSETENKNSSSFPSQTMNGSKNIEKSSLNSSKTFSSSHDESLSELKDTDKSGGSSEWRARHETANNDAAEATLNDNNNMLINLNHEFKSNLYFDTTERELILDSSEFRGVNGTFLNTDEVLSNSFNRRQLGNTDDASTPSNDDPLNEVGVNPHQNKAVDIILNDDAIEDMNASTTSVTRESNSSPASAIRGPVMSPPSSEILDEEALSAEVEDTERTLMASNKLNTSSQAKRTSKLNHAFSDDLPFQEERWRPEEEEPPVNLPEEGDRQPQKESYNSEIFAEGRQVSNRIREEQKVLDSTGKFKETDTTHRDLLIPSIRDGEEEAGLNPINFKSYRNETSLMQQSDIFSPESVALTSAAYPTNQQANDEGGNSDLRGQQANNEGSIPNLTRQKENFEGSGQYMRGSEQLSDAPHNHSLYSQYEGEVTSSMNQREEAPDKKRDPITIEKYGSRDVTENNKVEELEKDEGKTKQSQEKNQQKEPPKNQYPPFAEHGEARDGTPLAKAPKIPKEDLQNTEEMFDEYSNGAPRISSKAHIESIASFAAVSIYPRSAPPRIDSQSLGDSDHEAPATIRVFMDPTKEQEPFYQTESAAESEEKLNLMTRSPFLQSSLKFAAETRVADTNTPPSSHLLDSYDDPLRMTSITISHSSEINFPITVSASSDVIFAPNSGVEEELRFGKSNSEILGRNSLNSSEGRWQQTNGNKFPSEDRISLELDAFTTVSAMASVVTISHTVTGTILPPTTVLSAFAKPINPISHTTLGDVSNETRPSSEETVPIDQRVRASLFLNGTLDSPIPPSPGITNGFVERPFIKPTKLAIQSGSSLRYDGSHNHEKHSHFDSRSHSYASDESQDLIYNQTPTNHIYNNTSRSENFNNTERKSENFQDLGTGNGNERPFNNEDVSSENNQQEKRNKNMEFDADIKLINTSKNHIENENKNEIARTHSNEIEEIQNGNVENQENKTIDNVGNQENKTFDNEGNQENMLIDNEDNQENIAIDNVERQENIAIDNVENQENIAIDNVENQENKTIENEENQENVIIIANKAIDNVENQENKVEENTVIDIVKSKDMDIVENDHETQNKILEEVSQNETQQSNIAETEENELVMTQKNKISETSLNETNKPSTRINSNHLTILFSDIILTSNITDKIKYSNLSTSAATTAPSNSISASTEKFAAVDVDNSRESSSKQQVFDGTDNAASGKQSLDQVGKEDEREEANNSLSNPGVLELNVNKTLRGEEVGVIENLINKGVEGETVNKTAGADMKTSVINEDNLINEEWKKGKHVERVEEERGEIERKEEREEMGGNERKESEKEREKGVNTNEGIDEKDASEYSSYEELGEALDDYDMGVGGSANEREHQGGGKSVNENIKTAEGSDRETNGQSETKKAIETDTIKAGSTSSLSRAEDEGLESDSDGQLAFDQHSEGDWETLSRDRNKGSPPVTSGMKTTSRGATRDDPPESYVPIFQLEKHHLLHPNIYSGQNQQRNEGPPRRNREPEEKNAFSSDRPSTEASEDYSDQIKEAGVTSLINDSGTPQKSHNISRTKDINTEEQSPLLAPFLNVTNGAAEYVPPKDDGNETHSGEQRFIKEPGVPHLIRETTVSGPPECLCPCEERTLDDLSGTPNSTLMDAIRGPSPNEMEKGGPEEGETSPSHSIIHETTTADDESGDRKKETAANARSLQSGENHYSGANKNFSNVSKAHRHRHHHGESHLMRKQSHSNEQLPSAFSSSINMKKDENFPTKMANLSSCNSSLQPEIEERSGSGDIDNVAGSSSRKMTGSQDRQKGPRGKKDCSADRIASLYLNLFGSKKTAPSHFYVVPILYGKEINSQSWHWRTHSNASNELSSPEVEESLNATGGSIKLTKRSFA